jgi:GNAT superfamily N-acetyltransferase
MAEMYRYDLFAAEARTTIQATHVDSGEVVGSAFIYGNIMKSIWVDEDHRRRGVATGMWRFAEDRGLRPEHAANQSDDGKRWIESL